MQQTASTPHPPGNDMGAPHRAHTGHREEGRIPALIRRNRALIPEGAAVFGDRQHQGGTSFAEQYGHEAGDSHEQGQEPPQRYKDASVDRRRGGIKGAGPNDRLRPGPPRCRGGHTHLRTRRIRSPLEEGDNGGGEGWRTWRTWRTSPASCSTRKGTSRRNQIKMK